VIALWLGHESIETTHMYIEVDLAHKEQALQKLAPVEGAPPRFTADDPLLAFLTSL
jgi:integrase/recombinase XerD